MTVSETEKKIGETYISNKISVYLQYVYETVQLLAAEYSGLLKVRSGK